MRTRTKQVFLFSELNENAKQKAIEKYNENEDYFWIWNEAKETSNTFCKEFNIKTRNSCLEPITSHIDDCILELKGVRLMKYLNANYSVINKIDNYPLTGVYYDYTILKPLYDFIKKPCKNTTFEDLINDSFSKLKLWIESEIEYYQCDSYITEKLIEEETEFYVDGTKY